ncbi:hypothetical protein L9F63_002077, partial [Diploptera punctata]
DYRTRSRPASTTNMTPAGSIMSKQPHQEKGDDDHDSGTESDDEHGEAEDPESNSFVLSYSWSTIMKQTVLNFPYIGSLHVGAIL